MSTGASSIVSTVFSATTGSVSAINTIIAWAERLENFIQQCGEAGESIRDILNDVEAQRIELEQWKTIWQIKPNTTNRFQRELWGDSQTKVIRTKIVTIEHLCTKFHDKLESYHSGSELNNLIQTISMRDGYISNSRLLAAIRADAEAKAASASKTAKFVRSIKPQAREWLVELRKAVSELWEISKRAYYARHKDSVSDGGLSKEQLDNIKKSTLMRMAVELRNISEELFHLCLEANDRIAQERHASQGSLDGATVFGASQSSTKFKIDLTGLKEGIELHDVPFQKDIHLLYHLVPEWQAPLQELCIEGPLLGLESGRDEGGIFAAYKASQRNQEATILVGDSSTNKWFRSRLPRDTEYLYPPTMNLHGAGVSPSKSLQELLYDLDEPACVNSPDEFPYSQRVYVAFKIVECGLFISGTSWLSRLSTRTLQRFSTDRDGYYNYILEAPILHRKSFKNFEQLALHIFTIGIVLLEIGSGKLVRDIRSDRFGNQQFLLCKRGGGPDPHGQYLSAEAVKDILITTMGLQYASVTVYCFGEIGSKCADASMCIGDMVDESYKDILEDYFVNIYIP